MSARSRALVPRDQSNSCPPAGDRQAPPASACPRTAPRIGPGPLSRVRQHLQHFILQSGFFRPWRNQARTLHHYWAIYGAFRALIRSPYLQVALAITITCLVFWTKDKCGAAIGTANEISISVLPNLLGFTVGALAIVLAFSSADIFRTIAQEGKPRSFFMVLTSNLVHFIAVQVLALIAAIVAKATGSHLLDGLALFLLIYAVLVIFSAAKLIQAFALRGLGPRGGRRGIAEAEGVGPSSGNPVGTRRSSRAELHRRIHS
jgi:hypothetical protein